MPKITDEQLLQKEPYRSILKLFDFCVTKEHTKVGLTHAQLLYAISDESIQDKEIKNFFDQFESPVTKEKFEDKYKLKMLPSAKKAPMIPSELKRCHISPQRLIEKLQLLIDRGWVEFKGKPKYRTYFLTYKYHIDQTKRRFKKNIDQWSFDSTLNEVMIREESQRSEYFLCGIPLDIIATKLSDKETKKLFDSLSCIDDILCKILDLKYEKMKMTEKAYYEKFSPFIESKDMGGFSEYLTRLNDIGFYYHASKKMIEEKK